MASSPSAASAQPKSVGVFLQPFGMRSPGGGPRILRALVEDSRYRIHSISSSPTPPPESEFEEAHLRFRPHFGRVERSRFAWLPTAFDGRWKAGFRRRLEKHLEAASPAFVHLIPHDTLDFAAGFDFCRQKNIPCIVSVHDHPEYCFLRSQSKREQIRCFADVWRHATARTVISKELGESLDDRFGSQTWTIITDGNVAKKTSPRKQDRENVQIYFMGLMHQSYLPNLHAFCQAIEQLRSEFPNVTIRFRLRCGALPPQIMTAFPWLEVLPYADEATVDADIDQSDLLYLPLPFTTEHALFTNFSLSTKMVSYLAAARPIFFHGPPESAAGQLLNSTNSAFVCDSPDLANVHNCLHAVMEDPSQFDSIISNATSLAETHFSLPEIRKRFWAVIDQAVEGSVSLSCAG